MNYGNDLKKYGNPPAYPPGQRGASGGLARACDDLKVLQRYVVYPGEESYPARHGAQVIGLATLARQLQDA